MPVCVQGRVLSVCDVPPDAGFSMINMVTGVMVRSTFRAVGVNVKNKD